MQQLGYKLCNAMVFLERKKSQVLLNEARASRFPFPFWGGAKGTLTRAKYLGLIISAKAILEECLAKRIQAVRDTITSLVHRKFLFPGIDDTFALMLFLPVLQRNIDYACVLCHFVATGKKYSIPCYEDSSGVLLAFLAFTLVHHSYFVSHPCSTRTS